MEKMGFLAVWIERVMSFVITPSFSILVNGKPYGMIHPSRGIRRRSFVTVSISFMCRFHCSFGKNRIGKEDKGNVNL